MSNQIDNTQNISNLITLVSTGKLKNKSVRANGTAGKKPEELYAGRAAGHNYAARRRDRDRSLLAISIGR